MIILGNLKEAKKQVFSDLLKYLENPAPSVYLIMWGQESAGYKNFLLESDRFKLLKIECPALKKQREKSNF